ncbi:hypothetical protein PIB30_053158 [Stylosanthes scabra]|uniref:PB1-like domain-containing protein n=1 Tax=Stylosanthes scabra TaxID=79078 RepID=A0ABU6SIJ8_9FABA|nr:hypothetical protein [Stylosanthes scabra]
MATRVVRVHHNSLFEWGYLLSANVNMDEVTTFVYHHGGKLVTKDDGDVVYEMGEITEQADQEVDTLDVFAIRNFHKEIRYDQIEECYWLVPGRPLSVGLMVLATDAELLEMCFYAERNGRRIHIYYEHGVSVPNPVDEISLDLIEFPPSTLPDQAEIPTPVMVDVNLESDVDPPPTANANLPSNLQPNSPPKTQPISSKENSQTTTLPKANAALQKCVSAKFAKPKLTQPETVKPNAVKPNSAKPTSVKPNPAKPKTVQPSNKPRKSPTPTSPKLDQLLESSGSDSYDSAEDEMYTLKADEISSEDDDEDDFIVIQAR